MTKLLKKIILPVMLLSSLLIMTITFSGCSKPTKTKEYELLRSSDYAYTQGTQTIQITPLEYPPLGGEPATFKESISKSDIELLGILSTKTVDNVIFENEQSIKIVISGNAKPFNGNFDRCKIRIKKNGLNNDSNAYGYVDVHKPSIYIDSLTKSGVLEKGYTFQAIIKLTCGEFTDTDLIELIQDNSNASIYEKYLSSGILVITIKDIASDNAIPKIRIDAGATSLNKAIVLNIATGTNVYID